MASLINLATVLTQSFKADGTINSGGKVYVYQPQTSTFVPTYTTSSLSTQNPQPVVLDSSGYANIWINVDADVFVRDSNDVLIRSATNVNPTQPAGSSLTASNNSWTGTNSFTNTTTVLDATVTNAPLTAGQFQAGALNYAVTLGTPPAYTVTLPLLPSETVFTEGANFKVKFHATPTTGLVTLNVNGIGAFPLFYNGAQINGAGPILINDIWDIVYDNTNSRWHLFDVTSAGNNTFTGNNVFSQANEFTRAAASGIKPALALGPGSSNPGWSTDFYVQQIGTQTYIARVISSGAVYIANNAYNDGTNWRAIGGGRGELIAIEGGTAGPYDIKTYNLDNGAGGNVAAGAIFTVTNMGSLIREELSGTANTIVRRNSSGYINTSYLNMLANDIGTALPSRVTVETGTDGYLRWQTLANFRSIVNDPKITIITAAGSGTYTTPSGATKLRVIGIGAGGGSGGGGAATGGGGGGGGGSSDELLILSPASSYAYVVGTGGTAGGGGGNGGAGGVTSFNGITLGRGGAGGMGAAGAGGAGASEGKSGGTGGGVDATAGTSSKLGQGGNGGNGGSITTAGGGGGGSSVLASGANGSATGVNGVAGTFGSGAGGGGGSAGTTTGAQGGHGVLIVEAYFT